MISDFPDGGWRMRTGGELNYIIDKERPRGPCIIKATKDDKLGESWRRPFSSSNHTNPPPSMHPSLLLFFLTCQLMVVATAQSDNILTASLFPPLSSIAWMSRTNYFASALHEFTNGRVWYDETSGLSAAIRDDVLRQMFMQLREVRHQVDG
jgi:hypothetical protein